MKRGDSPIEMALKILSRKRASRKEIAQKLRKRGYTDEEIESAISYLEESHYIDDNELLSDYIKLLVEKKHYGPERVVAFLMKKGFESEKVRESLIHQYTENDFIQNAIEFINKKFKSINKDDEKTRQKIIRSLSYRGYNWDLIERVLSQ
jgi:regulatory protein